MNMSQVVTLEIPKVPAPFATFLLRIPLALMFFQQGLIKLPVNGAKMPVSSMRFHCVIHPNH